MERGFGLRQTDTLHNARFGLSPKVLYPYHPLFGEDLEVFGSAGGRRDMVYVRLIDSSTRGVPAWMFDPVICAGVRDSELPAIAAEALLRLVDLLHSAAATGVTVSNDLTKARIQDEADGPAGRPTVAASQSTGGGVDPGTTPHPVYQASPKDDAMRNRPNNQSHQ